MGLVLSTVWSVIAYIVTLTALNVWVALMFPRVVERAQTRMHRNPWGSFFLGAAVWGVSVTVWLVLINLKAGPAQLLGWLSVGPMLTLSVIGGAAFSQTVAGRIQPKLASNSAMVALVSGALCTTLAGVLPVLGWFVFLPISGFIAIGSALLGIFTRRPQAAPSPAPTFATPEPGFIYGEG